MLWAVLPFVRRQTQSALPIRKNQKPLCLTVELPTSRCSITGGPSLEVRREPDEVADARQWQIERAVRVQQPDLPVDYTHANAKRILTT